MKKRWSLVSNDGIHNVLILDYIFLNFLMHNDTFTTSSVVRATQHDECAGAHVTPGNGKKAEHHGASRGPGVSSARTAGRTECLLPGPRAPTDSVPVAWPVGIEQLSGAPIRRSPPPLLGFSKKQKEKRAKFQCALALGRRAPTSFAGVAGRIACSRSSSAPFQCSSRRICCPPPGSPGSCVLLYASNGTVEEPRACRAHTVAFSQDPTGNGSLIVQTGGGHLWLHRGPAIRPDAPWTPPLAGRGRQRPHSQQARASHWRRGTADVDRSVRARGRSPARTPENGWSLTCATQRLAVAGQLRCRLLQPRLRCARAGPEEAGAGRDDAAALSPLPCGPAPLTVSAADATDNRA